MEVLARPLFATGPYGLVASVSWNWYGRCYVSQLGRPVILRSIPAKRRKVFAEAVRSVR